MFTLAILLSVGFEFVLFDETLEDAFTFISVLVFIPSLSFEGVLLVIIETFALLFLFEVVAETLIAVELNVEVKNEIEVVAEEREEALVVVVEAVAEMEAGKVVEFIITEVVAELLVVLKDEGGS